MADVIHMDFTDEAPELIRELIKDIYKHIRIFEKKIDLLLINQHRIEQLVQEDIDARMSIYD